MGTIIRLSPKVSTNLSPENGATTATILRGRLRRLVGSLFNRVGIPGAVSDIEINDDLTGQQVSIKRDAYFTVISVNGRDYNFKRLTGKYDGTGYQMKC